MTMSKKDDRLPHQKSGFFLECKGIGIPDQVCFVINFCKAFLEGQMS